MTTLPKTQRSQDEKLVIHIVGARPNFMKVAPVMSAVRAKTNIRQKLVHTGQHYDKNMSNVFFQQLSLPEPDSNLEVGSGSHTVQTAEIMIRLEAVLREEQPDLVLVYGDVNSTVASALVCAKLGIATGHVEAGLRSYDRRMPEEINRVLTDQISDLLFTPSVDGNENLVKEGVNPDKIYFVGNVMIDTLIRLLPKTEQRWSDLKKRLNLEVEEYGLVTLHRPSNVDTSETLGSILSTLGELSKDIKLIFPVHPRTRQRMRQHNLNRLGPDVRLIEPIGYLEFLALQKYAHFVITDSGGVQEETTFLRVPCLTLRENTERPITISNGTNSLVDHSSLLSRAQKILNGETKVGETPPFWDGRAGERIADVVQAFAMGDAEASSLRYDSR